LSYPEDELQNVELAEEDQRKKNQDLKIKRRDYTGFDDEEFEPGNVGIRRGVLSKYDNVIDGEKTAVGLLRSKTGLLLIIL
jgi:U4/U6.U5 tri-snRNP-associated protein 1